MPKAVLDLNVLQKYIRGVIKRADHHANNVNDVILAAAGGIIWRKDTAPIEVMEQAGDMKNVLWIKVNRNRYAFSYNHVAGAIEIRRGTTQGTVAHSLTNNMSMAAVRNVFA